MREDHFQKRMAEQITNINVRLQALQSALGNAETRIDAMGASDTAKIRDKLAQDATMLAAEKVEAALMPVMNRLLAPIRDEMDAIMAHLARIDAQIAHNHSENAVAIEDLRRRTREEVTQAKIAKALSVQTKIGAK